MKQIEEPDEIELLQIDRRTLPKGHHYQDAGFEKRQVFDIDISRIVTEYRAQVLVDENGNRFIASFPKGVSKATQYGSSLKAHAVYMSQYQLLPYNRIQEYFAGQLNIPLSQGTIFNFNKGAFKRLASFSEITKIALSSSVRVHADETGAARRWIAAEFYLSSKGCFAMITGSPIIVM